MKKNSIIVISCDLCNDEFQFEKEENIKYTIIEIEVPVKHLQSSTSIERHICRKCLSIIKAKF